MLHFSCLFVSFSFSFRFFSDQRPHIRVWRLIWSSFDVPRRSHSIFLLRCLPARRESRLPNSFAPPPPLPLRTGNASVWAALTTNCETPEILYIKKKIYIYIYRLQLQQINAGKPTTRHSEGTKAFGKQTNKKKKFQCKFPTGEGDK